MSGDLPTLPTPPHPTKIEWKLVTATQTFESPLTGAVATYELPGAKWAAVLSYNSLTGDEAKVLQGFLFSQRGAAGRFKFYVPSQKPFATKPNLPIIARPNGQTDSARLTIGYKRAATYVPLDELTGGYVSAVIGSRQRLLYFSRVGSTGSEYRVSPSPAGEITADVSVDAEPFGIFRLKDDSQAKINLTGSGLLGSATFEIAEASR